MATIPQPAPPVEVISSQQIATLQARLEAMHAAKLLSEDQLCAIEDIVADFLELRYETTLCDHSYLRLACSLLSMQCEWDLLLTDIDIMSWHSRLPAGLPGSS